MLLTFASHSHATPPTRPNFTMHYTVSVPSDATARPNVTAELRGGNEVKRVIWRVDESHFSELRASGRLETSAAEWIWYPEHIDGSLQYALDPNHARGTGGFDSYRAPDWWLTRTSWLVPHKRVIGWKPVRAAARMTFALPPEWQVAGAMPTMSSTTLEVLSRGDAAATPYGWLLLGRLAIDTTEHSGTQVTIARPATPPFDPAPLRQAIAAALPYYRKLFGQLPDRLLVVTCPEPAWRGGLSGEDSLYISQAVPLVSRDRTSTVLHELFHVFQGFRKNSDRDDWLIEGLAEYYSLKIGRSTRLISPRQFADGIRHFDRQARFGLNLRTTTDPRVIYNGAPLLLFTVDEQLRRDSAGRQSLKDVIAHLARQREVSTEDFVAALDAVAPGGDWSAWLERHVIQGKRPNYETFLNPLGPSSSSSGADASRKTMASTGTSMD